MYYDIEYCKYRMFCRTKEIFHFLICKFDEFVFEGEEKEVWRYAYYLASACVERDDPALLYQRIASFDREKLMFNENVEHINFQLMSEIADIKARLLMDEAGEFFEEPYSDIIRLFMTDFKPEVVRLDMKTRTYELVMLLSDFIHGKDAWPQNVAYLDYYQAMWSLLCIWNHKYFTDTVAFMSEQLMHLVLYVKEIKEPDEFNVFCKQLLNVILASSLYQREVELQKFDLQLLPVLYRADSLFDEVFGLNLADNVRDLLEDMISDKSATLVINPKYIPKSFPACRYYTMSLTPAGIETDKYFRYETAFDDRMVVAGVHSFYQYPEDLVCPALADMVDTLSNKFKSSHKKSKLNKFVDLIINGEMVKMLGLY